MQPSRSSTRSNRSQSQIIGVVLLLLMYMAQPVLAAQYAFCGCSGISSSRTCAEDLGSTPKAESSSCCAQEAPIEVSQSCCGVDSDAEVESVCHCPLQPVDAVPNGVIMDAQAFAGPFVWWSELEAHANEFHWLAPHLGGLESEEGVRAAARLAWPPGGLLEPDRGPKGPASQRLCNAGLIAFLADLSVANL